MENRITELTSNKGFSIEKIPNGTNVVKLKMWKDDLKEFKNNLAAKGVEMNYPAKDFKGFKLKINPSINRWEPEKIVKAFFESL